MLQLKSANQWWPPADKEPGKARKGSNLAGVIYIPAKRVTDAARGISYDAPGGWYAHTWQGNTPIHAGDWLVRGISGNVYVIKQGDFYRVTAIRSLWHNMIACIKNQFRYVS